MGHDVIQVTGLSTLLVIMMLLLSLELDILEVCVGPDNWWNQRICVLCAPAHAYWTAGPTIGCNAGVILVCGGITSVRSGAMLVTS